MTKPKHTPGPWTLCYDGQIDGSKGTFICSFKWDCYKDFNENKELKANAQLIKMAPEMLEALDNLNCLLTELNADGKLPNNKKLNLLIREAFDVSEKAKGE